MAGVVWVRSFRIRVKTTAQVLGFLDTFLVVAQTGLCNVHCLNHISVSVVILLRSPVGTA